MNTLGTEEVKKYQELTNQFSEEKGQYDHILNNLFAQQSINQELIASST